MASTWDLFCDPQPDRISSSIFAGINNHICTGSDNGFVGAGEGNVIDVNSDYSTIAGGRQNLICGRFSAILGGTSNVINIGHDYSAAFGQGVMSAAANTFHVECLNAINTPAYAFGLPAGTYMKVAVTAGMIGVGFPPGTSIIVM